MPANAEADALLIFSCAGRLSALGPLAIRKMMVCRCMESADGRIFYLWRIWEASMANMNFIRLPAAGWH